MTRPEQTIALKTLGCKLNQYESEVIRQQFESTGYRLVPFGESADVLVINTCTVTGKSDTTSRQMVRQAIRSNPAADIIVTGCYAETNPEVFRKMKGDPIIVGNSRKFSLPDILKSINKEIPISTGSDYPLLKTCRQTTRAFVKIQDGCNYKCSYCKVRLARGKSRSVPLDKIIEQIRLLDKSGCKETVLTGVDIGSFGKDLSPRLSFINLLEEILSKTGIPAIRISSFDPADLNDRLITFLGKNSERIARHLHLPFQSGSNKILRKMRRRYSIEEFTEVVEKSLSSIPGVCIGADVMSGFPGETDKDFFKTVRVLEKFSFGYFHPFTYSDRQGTPAETFTDKVLSDIKKKRMKILKKIRAEKIKNFYDSQLPFQHRALIEITSGKSNGKLVGITDNYLRVPVGNIDSSACNNYVNIKLVKKSGRFLGSVKRSSTFVIRRS